VPGYRVLHEIARGGMGRVLAAYDLGLDRDVALKILLPGANSDRFARESKITARLPHPGIPPVHALGTLADRSPFLAMKLIAGHTLVEEMKRADRPRLQQAFLQVCLAVGFAHSRGIIRRDLKPANVMVGAFGEVQVMDWGLAKEVAGRTVADEPRSSEPLTVPLAGTDPIQTTDDRAAAASTDVRTEAGMVLGTPSYMAPEQARGETMDARADAFALGGILCAILTGKPPPLKVDDFSVEEKAAPGQQWPGSVWPPGPGQ
jgi:serine/threonine protein kinase